MVEWEHESTQALLNLVRREVGGALTEKLAIPVKIWQTIAEGVGCTQCNALATAIGSKEKWKRLCQANIHIETPLRHEDFFLDEAAEHVVPAGGRDTFEATST